MKLSGLKDEDFVNYKKPSMFLGTCKCDWKCCTEQDIDIETCQNSPLAKTDIIDVPVKRLFDRYINNPLTSAIVIGGLEPMMQFEEVEELIEYFRNHNCSDDFVIYTGYYPSETEQYITSLSRFANVIIKFGRYIPNRRGRYDEILGVKLASDNQFARRISNDKA